MKYIELFAGIGGFRYGLSRLDETSGFESPRETSDSAAGRSDGSSDSAQAGRQSNFTCVWANEIDKYACKIYRKNFGGGELYEGDITKFDERLIPDHDLIVGGFPCQAFSVAGRRGGFKDTRGTLFFDICRIAEAKRPRYMLLENVKGLLNHEKGDTFRTIICALDELGYDAEWQVLNSKDFGVPQNRERVFIVASLRGSGGREVFPLGQVNGISQEGARTEATENQYSTAITSNYRKGVHSGGETYAIGTLRTHKDGEGFREIKSGLSPTIPARAREDGSGQPIIAIPVIGVDRLGKSQNGRRFKENGDPSFTCTSQDRHGVYDGVRIRRLTPVECERLQGFPDNWTEGISDTQRYKCIGNAVTTNVITAIGRKFLCSIR